MIRRCCPLLLCVLSLSGCRQPPPAATANHTPAPLAAGPLPADHNQSRAQTIRFLENRVRQDPEDVTALNKLAGYYLQLQRETGDAQYLELAERAANASLQALPAVQNKAGLGTLAVVAYAAHRFAEARDLARQLISLEPDKGYPYQTLGDALLELGDYDGAQKAYAQSEQLSGVTFGNEVRRARLAALRGRLEDTPQHYAKALLLAQDARIPEPETIAWTHWQLGETAFATGKYTEAEKHYQDSLAEFPDYYRALGGLARARAAQGDTQQAIEIYERLVKRLPDPVFVAALGDLYQLAGRAQEAAAQHALVEQIAKLTALNGALYNRQLANFYADHDLKTDEAYAAAAKEYESRRDIYGADALAWAALKAGKIAEAQNAAKDALRLGTKDAKLLYHAGLIARAGGDKTTARKYLRQALALSPNFDPLQATLAQKALKE
jgi:tetratricopeptide (TPR) repeat protein